MDKRYIFHGDPHQGPQQAHPDAPPHPEPYKAERPLIDAVNLAIYLKRPLLLEGEAGCGKTRLAHAVAYELGVPLYRWDVRSTSKAQEGLYRYDSILRLHDVQVKQAGGQPTYNPADPKQYRSFGALGNAFRVTECRAVVLIDEIDKADLDFPNDLLAVLEEPWEFEIPETGETGEQKISAAHKPIILITSNKEKGNLPAPFLRRCLYHFVQFPDEQGLKEIVNLHYRLNDAKTPDAKLVDAALTRFNDLREKGGLHKKPGTSEFLDWIDALHNFAAPPYQPSQLADASAALPYPEVLFKLKADWQNHARL